MEALTLQGANPIATFRGGRMAGKPAITRHKYGQGWVFYVGTDSGKREFHEALARIVGETVGLRALINAPYGVEVNSREDDKATYYFLLNLTETPYKRVSLSAAMDNVLTGERAVEAVDLGPLEVAILPVSKILR